MRRTRWRCGYCAQMIQPPKLRLCLPCQEKKLAEKESMLSIAIEQMVRTPSDKARYRLDQVANWAAEEVSAGVK